MEKKIKTIYKNVLYGNAITIIVSKMLINNLTGIFNKTSKRFPIFANWLKLQQKPIAKDQTATFFSHWFLLILFSLVTVATFTQQLLFLLFVFVIAALVKGPGMILWGVVYSFLVTLFPPLGLLLSTLFFLSAHSQAVDKKLDLYFLQLCTFTATLS